MFLLVLWEGLLLGVGVIFNIFLFLYFYRKVKVLSRDCERLLRENMRLTELLLESEQLLIREGLLFVEGGGDDGDKGEGKGSE
jgi:hypothetical protein